MNEFRRYRLLNKLFGLFNSSFPNTSSGNSVKIPTCSPSEIGVSKARSHGHSELFYYLENTDCCAFLDELNAHEAWEVPNMQQHVVTARIKSNVSDVQQPQDFLPVPSNNLFSPVTFYIGKLDGPLIELIIIYDILQILNGQDGIIIYSHGGEDEFAFRSQLPSSWLNAIKPCLEYASILKTFYYFLNINLASHAVSQAALSLVRKSVKNIKLVIQNLQELFYRKKLGFSQLMFHLEEHFKFLHLLSKFLPKEEQSIWKSVKLITIVENAPTYFGGDPLVEKISNILLSEYQRALSDEMVMILGDGHYERFDYVAKFLADPSLPGKRLKCLLDSWNKIEKILPCYRSERQRRKRHMLKLESSSHPSPVNLVAETYDETCREILIKVGGLPGLLHHFRYDNDLTLGLNFFSLAKGFYSLQMNSPLERFLDETWPSLLLHVSDNATRAVASSWEVIKQNDSLLSEYSVDIAFDGASLLEQVRLVNSISRLSKSNYPNVPQRSRVIDCISFNIKHTVPLCFIFDQSVNQKYELFLRFLMKILNLEKGLVHSKFKEKSLSLWKSMSLFLLRGLHQYLIFDVLENSWTEFQEKFASMHSFDTIKECHIKFLDSVLSRSLLDNPDLMLEFHKIFDLISILVINGENYKTYPSLGNDIAESTKLLLDLLKYTCSRGGNFYLELLLARIAKSSSIN